MTTRKIAAFLMGLGLTLSSSAFAQDAPSTSSPSPGQGVPAMSRVDPWPGMKRLLILADVQNGYHHDSINHAMAVIEQLGRESGKWVSVIRTDSQVVTKEPIIGTGERYGGRNINARNLDFYDAIFFLGSGSGTLSDEQKADLLSFVRDDGKGFLAGHAAGVAFFDWPEFYELIGAPMESEYPTGVMTVRRVDPNFPGASAFPEVFSYNDQFPVTPDTFTSVDVNVIFALDAEAMTEEQRARRPDGDFPIIWSDTYGAGRVFNLGVGHREEVWDDPKFRTMVSGAIEWALGLVDDHGEPVTDGE
jgi:uncharacterized protein